MKSQKITIRQNEYLIHSVSDKNYEYYKNILNFTNICDPLYISPSYESNSYNLLQDEGFVGFFLTNQENTVVYCSIVFDLEAHQLADYLSKNDYDVKDVVSITLLCSNAKKRISGVTGEFLKHVIKNLIKKYKPTIDFIFLNVSKGETNKRAMNFYKNNGFILLDRDNSIMINNIHGGGKSKVHTQKNRFQKRKSGKTKKNHRKTSKLLKS